MADWIGVDVDDAMPERWLPVPGYEGFYEVSDYGRVKTLRRTKANSGFLKPALGKQGYWTVSLCVNRQQKTFTVHRLIAAAFIGPCPEGQEVRHLDGDRQNCRLSNLAYGTRGENNLDAVEHGTHNQVRKTHCPQGHPYDEENTLVIPSRPSARYCRQCNKDQSAARRAA